MADISEYPRQSRHSPSPLRAGTKIQSGTDPLREVMCFFISYARRDFQRVIRNVTHEEGFFILVGDVIHAIDAHVSLRPIFEISAHFFRSIAVGIDK
jgi:hypothetical protein